ncbi:MAG: RIP metalloprotease RseP [Alphaproteobacteria bacterium]|nr:RIP metalloprotease RseP [Alphaproteobacteria bacterium]
MSWLVDAIHYVVPFIVLLGILVFVHEFGHFIVARLCGVAVTEFSIGFGKKLWGFTDKKNTEWKISAIPLGGYCKFLGDEDATSSSGNTSGLSEEDKKVAFATQNPLKKMAIVIAGPGANYLFAIFIFAFIFFAFGKFEFPAVVGDVVAGSSAEMGGIQKGDKITKVNDKIIKNFSDITQEVTMHTSGNIKLEIEREGKIINLSFPLKSVPLEIDNQKTTPDRPMLGIKSVSAIELSPEKLSLLHSISDACAETWRITAVTLRGVGQMIAGRRSADEVGGILRIAEMSGDITKQNGLIDFVAFMALLSINLGLINLFPIPLLDGGHVVIYMLEIVSRREINERIKEYIFRFGLFVLISLMLFATYNDFVHLFKRWFS